MRAPDFGRLELLVAESAGGAVPARGPVHFTEMPGGASTRRYFRVARGADPSAVAMFVPEGAKPEELSKDAARHRAGAAEAKDRWPFLEVRDLLAGAGVDVPALYAEDQDHGWLLLEDLGDDTLANYLTRHPDAREKLYRQAVVDLARAQRALAALPPESIVAGRAFDADLLRWEIDHFREWGLEARGHVLSPEDRAAYDAIAQRLADRIASWPRGFVHRDYQSRNLMVRESAADGPSLCWIDFQDALLGPRVYDLVALLSDSYQTFDRAFVEARLRDFATEAREAGGSAEGGTPQFERALENLIEQFDYVTVQRKLKDAARFVFIERKKGNDTFLRFVEPTIAKVQAALARLSVRDPDMTALDRLLRRTLQAGQF